MALLIGDTVPKRKKCLAELVVQHLIAKGYAAKLVENRANSEGHTDQVVVESEIGLIHLTASSSLEPNVSVPTAGYRHGDQTFLADKDYVVYGWNTKDGRTFILFVKTDKVVGKLSLTKNEIKQLSERSLNGIFSA